MMHEVVQTNLAYEKPTVEVLGGFAQLTLFTFDPNKWKSAADIINGTAIAEGGIGS